MQATSVLADADKVNLFDSMLAYAGRYTLDHEKVVHHVDISWNQMWTGTDQVRFYKLDAGILILKSTPAKDPYTGQETVHTVTWERLQSR